MIKENRRGQGDLRLIQLQVGRVRGVRPASRVRRIGGMLILKATDGVKPTVAKRSVPAASASACAS